MSDVYDGVVNKYGQPVTGDNFLFRQIELRKVMRAIENNNSFFYFWSSTDWQIIDSFRSPTKDDESQS